jgi:hypothetical protein
VRPPGALLLNWLALEAGAEQDFELWHNREHAAERVGLPGFRRCRRYVTAEPTPAAGFGMLIAYEGDDAQAFSGADYAARLNDPTPQTMAMVPRLRQVSRAVLTVINSWRVGIGAWACTAAIGAAEAEADIWPLIAEITSIPAVAEVTFGRRAEIADAKGGTVEARYTDGGTQDAAAVLLIGSTRPAGIEQAVALMRRGLGQPAIHRFQLSYLLDRHT